MSFSVDQITGVMPALMTPYDKAGEVDYKMARRLAAHLVEEGAQGFFVCGSTGEGLFLSEEERKQLARAVIEEVGSEVPIIVHVGAASTKLSMELARDAKRAGAAAVSSIPPIYYKVGLEGMMQHIRGIAQAAELPTYYYHIPSLTGVQISADQLVEEFSAVEGLAGLKFTDTDMFYLWMVINGGAGRLRVFHGADQMLFNGLCVGACGGIGSTYNYQMQNIAAVYQAHQAGDLEAARAAQVKANEVIRVLFRNGANLSCEKEIMKLKGFDLGTPRSPMVPFDAKKFSTLKEQLEAIGFFD